MPDRETSPAVVSGASKILTSPTASKAAKSVAASALSQATPKARPKKKSRG